MFTRTVHTPVDVRDAQQGTMVLDAPGSTPVTIPGDTWLLDAAFVRSGSDLVLLGDDGAQVVVRGYFTHDVPPDLTTDGGAVISGHLAEILAGSRAPALTAQAAPGAAAEPIGTVKAVDGTVTLIRTDGTHVGAESGTEVFQGDTIETGTGAAIGVTFVDDTTFSLGEDGRMVIDELVYDAASKTGAFKTALVQGVFSFVSGQIAKTGPESMVLTTPVATIGIRGTKVAGRAAQEGAQNTIALLPEVDAQGNQTVGELTVSNAAGSVTLNQVGATVQMFSFNAPPPPPVILPVQQLEQQFGSALNALPDTPAPTGDEAAGEDGGEKAADGEDGEAAPEGDGEGDGEQTAEGDGTDEAPPEEGDTGEGDGLPAEGVEDGEQVAQAAGDAFEQALAEGATEEQAGEAAIGAAREEALAQGATDEQFDAAAAAAEAAYAEAIANGATPEEAMAAAQAAASQVAAGFGAPDQGGNTGFGGDIFGPDPFGANDPFGGTDPFGSTATGTSPYEGAPVYTGDPGDVFGPDPFDPGFDFELPPPDQGIGDEDVVIDFSEDPDAGDLANVVFGEEFSNTSGSDEFHGNTENTEYIYAQNEDGTTVVDVANGGAFAGGGHDTILDDGGDNDRLTFESLDSVAIKMQVHPDQIEANDPTTMRFTLYDITGMARVDNGGGSFDVGNGVDLMTLDISTDVEDIQGSAEDLASPDAGGVVLGGAMDLWGGETAYMVAGGADANVIDLSQDPNAMGAVLFGKGGNDTLTGTAGAESVIYGGDGNDVLDGMGGANALFGGEGDDLLSVTVPLSGNILSGGNGVDTVCYGGIETAITGAFYNETVAVDHGNGYTDELIGIEVVNGSALGDTFIFYGDPSSAGLATLNGGDGVDTFTIGSGLTVATSIDGGAGGDTLYKAFDATYAGTASNIENAVILGTAANDTIVAASDFAGNAVAGVSVGAVYAGQGDDSVTLLADTANEMVIDSAETITAAGTGADVITLGSATAGAIIDLGGDTDHLNVAAGANLVELSNVEGVTMSGIAAQHTLTFGTAQNNEMTVTGSTRTDDTLILANGTNTLTTVQIENITAGDGDDTVDISGAIASGTVDLGAGADELWLTTTGGQTSSFTVANTETIAGDAGNETIVLTTALPAGYVDLGAGTDALTLADGGNALAIGGVEQLTGGGGDDSITVYGAMTGASVNLGDGTDSLTLADGVTNSLSVANVEVVTGGTGNDTITVAAETLDNNAHAIDGGGGSNVLNLTWSSSGSAYLSTTELANIQGFQTWNIASDKPWNLFPNNANVASGQVLTVDATAVVTPTNFVNWNAGAETDGRYQYLGGAGDDTVSIQGSALDGSTDLVLSGGGHNTGDALQIYGSGLVALNDPELQNVTGFEYLRLYSNVQYSFSFADNNVAAGETLTIENVASSQTNYYNGQKEYDGNFVMFGGSGGEFFTGGAGDDQMTGGGGADQLAGLGGSDVFRYTAADESPAGAGDTIMDFDATDDAEDLLFDGLLSGTFAFLGDATQNSFTATGNTEALFSDVTDLLQVDTDGDGFTDIDITLDGVALADLDVNDFTVTGPT